MVVAITADLHLTNNAEHPERFHALEYILDYLISNGIRWLIIAGDLFDISQNNYHEFETLCKSSQYKNINILILPGNHDSNLSKADILSENVQIITQPELVQLGNGGYDFLLVPYIYGKSMGEVLVDFCKRIVANKWHLVGHGDWFTGMRTPNTIEPGIYMPLSKKDIQRFKPKKVFLGHLHYPHQDGLIHYPGSPCGLDISETGFRSFLTYDTEMDLVEIHKVETDIVFFDETFTIYPASDEIYYLTNEIENRIKGWQLAPADIRKVRLRVKLQGYTTDREKILKKARKLFSDYQFIADSYPDISRLSSTISQERNLIAEQVMDIISYQKFDRDPNFPDKDQIILSALDIIYGK